MPDPTERALALIAELFEASARAHTDATLLPAVERVLARHFPLRRFELRRGEAAPGAPEARRAGPVVRVVLPIRDAEGTIGRATFEVDASLAAPADLAPALLDAMARVIGVALRQVDTLGRVAGIAHRTQGEKRLLREEIEQRSLPAEIVAVSPAMRAIVHEMVPLVARQDTTVLLRGETGTGKEVIARRVHALSRRAARPFVAVNCGALPDGLVESALFGHERGAFTGAAQRRLGLFERAHGGTLLLDEVGELPAAAQARLLRALQEGEIERVGGESAVRVDVRVIAATHRPLEEMMASGAFREDLYYRLNVFPIVIPRLRDRPEDLGPLARALVDELAAKLGRRPPRLPEETLARLRAYDWPGNLRELRNVLERALVLSTGDALVLPSALVTMGSDPRSKGGVSTYRDAMREHLERALRASGGKIYGEDGAAKALDLKPTTLQSKLRRLGIRR